MAHGEPHPDIWKQTYDPVRDPALSMLDFYVERLAITIADRVTEALKAAPSEEDLLTASEAARRLRVSVTALNKHGREGDIPRVYHGRTVRYRTRDIDAILAAGGIPPKPRPSEGGV